MHLRLSFLLVSKMKIKDLNSGDRFVVKDTPFPREIFVKVWDVTQEGYCVGLRTGHVKSWTRNTEVECVNTYVGCSLVELEK